MPTDETSAPIWVTILLAILGGKLAEGGWNKLMNWRAGQAETKKKEIDANASALDLTGKGNTFYQQISEQNQRLISIGLEQAQLLAAKDVEIEAQKRVIEIKEAEVIRSNKRAETIIENNGALKERHHIDQETIEDLRRQLDDALEHKTQSERLINANLTGLHRPDIHATDQPIPQPRFDLGTDTQSGRRGADDPDR